MEMTNETPMMKRISLMALLTLVMAGNALSNGNGHPQAEDIAFTAACDGTEQRYVLMLPAGFKSGQPHDLLVALHGHGSDRWQFVRNPRDECRAARDVAAAHKMIYVSPDYRASTSWMGPKAEADVVQIIGDLKCQHHIRRVFICGGSMGGTASLTFAALHPDLADGVAAMNATANHIEYANFQDAIAASFGGDKTAVPHEYRNRSAELNSERLTMPVGLTVGGNDNVVPPQSVLRLAEALRKQGRRVLMIHRKKTGHSTNYKDAKALLEFVIQKTRQQP
jgi:dipeptidyl aminopeptidase/acylaminoacyl peptidase